MGLVEKQQLLANIAPPLDQFLALQLVDEFISVERRFIQRDWEPAELDGGQFAEILARILYHQDSGNLNRARAFDDCLKYLENDQVPHAVQPRSDALHIARVLRAVYKFRSQRGAVHISPTYGPNHLDAKFIVEAVRWSMSDTLRAFWQGDREAVAKAIRELLQFDVPCVGSFDATLLVQRTDLSAEEEILVLLHYAGEVGMSRAELGRHAQVAASSVSRAVAQLIGKDRRQVVKLSSGNYRLTDLGQRRIREELADKLLVQ